MINLLIIRYTMIIVIMFSIAACSVIPKPSVEQDLLLLLEQEIIRWNTFKIVGFTEFQYQAFSIRGQAILAKIDNKFRFDILNQGILGLGGGVVIAVYVDEEQVQTRMFGSSTVETYELDSQMGDMMSFLSENLFQAIYSQRNKIIETYKGEFEGFEIIFTPEMRISDIYNPVQNIRASFVYDRQNNLTELRLSTPFTRNFIIHVDNIEHDNIVINPLK